MLSSLGVGVKHNWARLVNGEGSFTVDETAVEMGLPAHVVARVPEGSLPHEFDLDRDIPKSLSMTSTRFIQYAWLASQEAVQQSGFRSEDEEDLTRCGVSIGSGIGSVSRIVEAADTLRTRGYRRISPYFIPSMLVNIAAGQVSIAHNLQGPNLAPSTACTTGAHAIGDAFRLIKYGDADLMVAGGTEASLDPLSMAGFSRLRALSTGFNGDPDKASRPFEKERDGFVMGEGCGVVVLEELSRARARGAPILAEVVGYGMSGDAFHLTSPADGHRGAAVCLTNALREANIDKGDVDYLNAHATSTPLGDALESQCYANMFDPKRILVSSTKGAVGHALGAAGALESIFTILSVAEDIAPPTRNLFERGNDVSDMDFVPLEARSTPIRVAATNSFGFGGTNASIVFKKYED